MELINKITSDLKDFINFFNVKYKYDHRGIIKRYKLKSGLNKHLSEESWYELFLRKSAYNYCAKLILIKYWEDTGKIMPKINKVGLDKWNNFISNISSQYGILYKIAELDVSNVEELKEAFKKTDYDIYEMDNELSEFIILKLKEYSFKSFSYETIYHIFSSIYMDDNKTGPELQYFYKPANAIEFILSIEKHQENFV